MFSYDIIAVDFDGTLFKDNYPEIGEPIWSTINFCKQKQKEGSTLILWSCRQGEELDKAVKACEDVDLHFDYINSNTTANIDKYQGIDNRKIYATLYIDDKAITPNDIVLINKMEKMLKKPVDLKEILNT